jgi:hypothetical protein
MSQYLGMIVALVGHDCRADLAQPDSVAPACASKPKSLRVIIHTLRLYDKGRAIEVRARKRATYLKLFSNDKASRFAPDSEPDYSPRLAALKRLKR